MKRKRRRKLEEKNERSRKWKKRAQERMKNLREEDEAIAKIRRKREEEKMKHQDDKIFIYIRYYIYKNLLFTSVLQWREDRRVVASLDCRADESQFKTSSSPGGWSSLSLHSIAVDSGKMNNNGDFEKVTHRFGGKGWPASADR